MTRSTVAGPARTAAWALLATALGCTGLPSPRSAAQTPARAAPTRPETDAPPPAYVELRGAEGPVRVEVELARTDAEQARGLAGRHYVRRGHGMLFVYPQSAHRQFWMRNTYVPLDMIFIGADRHVVGVVANAPPLTRELRAVEGDSQYVLEVGGGFAARHAIGPGTAVRFENVSGGSDVFDGPGNEEQADDASTQ